MSEAQHPLRDWRQANKVTLQILASRVGVTQSHLSEIENWKNEPSLGLAAKLSRETGIDMARFAPPAERASA